MLHGFANSGAWWLPWALPLSRHFQIHLPDLPGHGEAVDASPPGADPFAEIADEIEAYIAAQRLSEVRLVGFSFGAYLGQYLLTHRPGLPIHSFLNIEHPPWTLVAVDFPCGMSRDVLAEFAQVVHLVNDDAQLPLMKVGELPKLVADAYLTTIVRIAEKSLSNQAATWLLEQVMGTGPVRRWILQMVGWPWGYRIIRAYHEGTYDLRAKLSSIKVPVWAVGTREASLFAGDPLPYLGQRIPNFQPHYFEGASHAFLYRHPLQFHDLLEKFLNS